MKTKRMIASLMAIFLAICFHVTAWASTSTWPPKAEEVFRNSGLVIYDSTSTAVATSIEIVSNPQTLSFSGVPQFFSSDGKKLGDMDYAARMKLEEEYKANNNNSADGFALWLVNMFNDYRGVGKITQQAMDDYWGKKQADAAAKTAEWETKQRSDLNSLTYQDVFAGINIVVTDKGKQAVRVAGYEFPIKTMYFLDANENKLGYMSGDAYLAMIEKCGETYGKVLNSMPGGSGGFYAQMFNDYRGVKRLTVDEYLDIVRVKRSAISAEGLAILEQVYLKSNGSSASGNSSSSSNSPTVIDVSGWPSDIVRLTNKERGKEGLDALYEDSRLMELAAIRAKELAQEFSHTRPNGERATTWASGETGFSGVGENIAAGYTSPQNVLGGWMNSSGHKANILNDKYTAMGAGYYQDSQTGKTYWVQLFAYSSSGRSSGGGAASNGTTYSLNETELHLSAGEDYQLSVEASGPAQDFEVVWAGSKIANEMLSVDDNGYVTTFYRESVTTASAKVNISAKIYVSGRLVETLKCRVIVTQ